MKFYYGKTNTNFHDSEMPKETYHCIFLSVTVM